MPLYIIKTVTLCLYLVYSWVVIPRINNFDPISGKLRKIIWIAKLTILLTYLFLKKNVLLLDEEGKTVVNLN